MLGELTEVNGTDSARTQPNTFPHPGILLGELAKNVPVFPHDALGDLYLLGESGVVRSQLDAGRRLDHVQCVAL